MACCPECYDIYVAAVLAARAQGNDVSTAPVRSDMSPEQYEVLMSTPVEQVFEEAKEEFVAAGYGDELETLGLGGVVDLINEELSGDKAEKSERPRKKKHYVD